MATTLRVTPDVAKSKAAEMQTKGQEIRSITSNVTALIDGLIGRVWSGEAETAYLNSYHAAVADVEKLIKLVEDNAIHLNEIAAAYATTETEATTRSSSLDKGFLE